jgi:hypothetical protein
MESSPPVIESTSFDHRGLVFRARELAKKVAYRLLPLPIRYPYGVEPLELFHFMAEVKRCEEERVPGDIVEVGVARGKTTNFMCRFLGNIGSKRRYIAVDTFSGFVSADADYERSVRGRHYPFAEFAYNDVERWKRSLAPEDREKRIHVIPGDIRHARFADGQRFAVAFVDVDLYQPTLHAIKRLMPLMAKGGAMLVDDVLEGTQYDGAHDAFFDACKQLGIHGVRIPPRLGLIRVA